MQSGTISAFYNLRTTPGHQKFRNLTQAICGNRHAVGDRNLTGTAAYSKAGGSELQDANIEAWARYEIDPAASQRRRLMAIMSCNIVLNSSAASSSSRVRCMR